MALTQANLPLTPVKAKTEIILDESQYPIGSVVVNFLVNGDPIKVKTRSSMDLPLSLIGWAAVWIDLAQINASAYHLHYLYNNQSFPPIEYINNNWYYLNWDNRRYYTKPHSQIDTPMSFSLGTHLTPSIEAVF